MKKMKMSAPTPEQRCPACDGVFTISSANRRKRVQCPQCREVVTLVEPGELNGAGGLHAAPELPPVDGWKELCEALQARIETLEHQVEALMVTPRTNSSLIPERLNDRSQSPCDRGSPGILPQNGQESHADGTERREVFRTEMPAPEAKPHAASGRSFQPSAPEIRLLVTSEDGAAGRVTATLTEILVRTGWTVRGVTEVMALANDRGGLTLAAAPTLPLPRVTSTLNALREAGFAVTFQLDSERDANEALLIVGAGSENEPGLKS